MDLELQNQSSGAKPALTTHNPAFDLPSIIIDINPISPKLGRSSLMTTFRDGFNYLFSKAKPEMSTATPKSQVKKTSRLKRI